MNSDSFNWDRINEQQRQAVLVSDGPVLIIAGPGTGKTFTLVKRVAYLVMEKNVSPERIMVVTFTEKAAKELLTRISNEFLNYNVNINMNEMYIDTFHSVCLRLMKEHLGGAPDENSKRMMDAFEQTYLVCRNIDEFRFLKNYSKWITANEPWQQALDICTYVNQIMEELVDFETLQKDSDEDVRFLGKLVARYTALLERHGVMDFSAIQTETYRMLETHPEILANIRQKLDYIMVDEYQDTNYIQEQIVFAIAGDKKNICVVGDDDQGMYRFRGATIRNILEFPDKFAADECKIIKLSQNYRSEDKIIQFYNRWMQNVDGINLFNWDKYRFDKEIVPARSDSFPGDSVFACDYGDGGLTGAGKKKVLDIINRLIANGNINNFNQAAFLFRSVKSKEASELGSYLEQNGIPVYSPRSDMFFDRMEVKQLIGCIMWCFNDYMDDLKKNHFNIEIPEKLKSYYIGCVKLAMTLMKQNKGLQTYIMDIMEKIRNLKGAGTTSDCRCENENESENESEHEWGLLDIFYRIISFEPFALYLSADLNGNITETRAARNLAELSRMIARFNFLHDMHKITPENKTVLPEEFFNIYIKYLYIDGVGEYEDESEYAPSGCVSFMTIHQSKGLEFPVVVVGSLNSKVKDTSNALMSAVESRFYHRPPFEPLENIKYFDFWRLYYTAFSRAQNMLILMAGDKVGKYFLPYIKSLPGIETWNCGRRFGTVKDIHYKHVYSFTSHISVYDGCPMQYKFYKEYAFAQNKMFHTSVGSLVHATLEDMNKCIISGNLERVGEETITEWFWLNYAGMQEQTGYFLTDEQQTNALNQVIRYFRHRKNELGRVWKAEEEINLVLPDYILQGIIDLVESDEDAVEIVDYKTGPKPVIEGHPERVEHYRKQLEIYAYLVEKRYGRKVKRMHLYYTSTSEDGNPLITFEWNRENVNHTVDEISETVRCIEEKKFDRSVQNSYACEFCDMRYVCGKEKC